ncbi:MAG: DUF86 domain-containing protein [Cyclobacteriaceae bacterium]|nr:DUF86 domain-containing protein [Cyclobacteriaceae bacterium]
MAERDVSLFVDDIIESIQRIEEYTSNLTEAQFEASLEKQDAVFRRLEIIGEAVKNIPKETRSKFPNVPWQHIAGLRDVITHNYFGLIPKRIWNIIKNDIPSLKVEIKKVRENFK